MSGLTQHTPISMKALNMNLDQDLIFTGSWNKIRNCREMSNASLNQNLILSGGTIPLDPELIINSRGLVNESFRFYTTNAAGNAQVEAMHINGNIDAPYLDMCGHVISNIQNPSLQQDAVTLAYLEATVPTQGDLTVSAPVAISNSTRHLIGGAAALSLVNDAAATVTEIDTGALDASDTKVPTNAAVKTYVDGKYKDWASWTPTLVWTAGAPAALSRISRWVRIGDTVHFNLYLQSADSNATKLTSFSLPATLDAQWTTGYYPFTTFILNTNSYTYVNTCKCYVDCGTSRTVAVFFAFPTTIDGQWLSIAVNGTYEAA